MIPITLRIDTHQLNTIWRVCYYIWLMVEMQGLTLQQLQDLYDASDDEVRGWMRENIRLAFGNEKPE